jgi:hypothetical protein
MVQGLFSDLSGRVGGLEFVDVQSYFSSENGFSAMCMRVKHGGELWWTLNMAVHGMGEVLMNLMGRMGRGYGRLLGGIGGSWL